MSKLTSQLIDTIVFYKEYVFVNDVAKSIIYGDISRVSAYLNVDYECVSKYIDFIPIKKQKRECGLELWVYDRDKSQKIMEDYQLNYQSRESLEKTIKILIKTNQEIDPKMVTIVKDIIQPYLDTESPYCHLSLGKCRCAAIERDSTRSGVLEVLKQDIITDSDIKDYVTKNPETPEKKPFGEPQSKFRNGTYGLHGMEINSWHR
ncbi:hypothetical protein L4C54_03725 [Vibrio lamellibrachiae]|uniref:hypothetical protein n=1 Tax=Vibrio lamellibrachiae TaxID=2910253 RepID=UPI003D0F8F00